ncbi:MAG: UDP-3-O-(3-hydroxymyristoyl)glucosamine N-acyltransferase [Deltaproteobacteria bacterium]|nr:MAG: UDP-3-O-(3-hydroxymyristoyl)glucosamine N-acyltransferase [Deltaproteobacteria bacterium]
MEMNLEAISRLIGGEVIGEKEKRISGVAPFDDAGPHQITCAFRPGFLKKIQASRAGAIIVPRHIRSDGQNLVAVENPQLAFIKIVNRFFSPRDVGTGVDPMAAVGDDFKAGEALYVGPCAVIGKNVRCGHRVKIHAGVVIGPGVVVGDDVVIFPNVTIGERCRIGDRVTIHPGAVIGSDGFGFAPDGEKYVKIPHTGIVRIDDDVEIGANTTIDRGTFGQTWLKRGVKTDNLVHVAHNVTVGEDTLLVAQVGISGSSTLGRHVIMAGQAGVAGHLDIGDHVTIGPRAGIAKSIKDGQVVSGAPEMPHRLWLKVVRLIPRLPEFFKKLSRIEKRLEVLEDKPKK